MVVRLHDRIFGICAALSLGLTPQLGLAFSDGTVASEQKISDLEGGFAGTLHDFDLFGRSVAALGDLDGDGVIELAVGAEGDADGGGRLRGAVWVLFLNADGTVKAEQKISDLEGGFTGTLEDQDLFGVSVAGLGDVDGDGVTDLAVGAAGDDDGGGVGDSQRGAVWVLFLNADGTVKAEQKISDLEGGFTGTLGDGDNFGISVAKVGDLDGDGVQELAVGAPGDDDGGGEGFRGAVWILFLNTDGTVRDHQKISDLEGGFTGTLDDFDAFGAGVGGLGDLDGDGVDDLAVGAIGEMNIQGAAWVLFLNADGTVKAHQKISELEGGFTGTLDDEDRFGRAVTGLGDLDGDGAADVAISANEDDDGGSDRGAVWVLFLNVDGTVKAEQKISNLEGGFTGTLDDGDHFGISVAALGDLDGDGAKDVAVGAQGDNDGGEVGVVSQRGAVWVLFLNAVPGDLDNDGVTDADDVCPATVLPEPVPTKRLGPNRYANTDSDIAFETRRRKRASRQEFTMTDTAGCSCAQIIQELGLGQGHTKFGCSVGAMKRFIAGLP